jgi:hypothetical protein
MICINQFYISYLILFLKFSKNFKVQILSFKKGRLLKYIKSVIINKIKTYINVNFTSDNEFSINILSISSNR